MSSRLSEADRTYLSQAEQAQILALKDAWEKASAAGDRAGMTEANRQAEAIRAGKGYQGGSDGSGHITTAGGSTAAQVKSWVDEYKSTNYRAGSGWINGYSTEMNQRSMANYIRQQMEQNSKAWASADDAGRSYLHEQNRQLAELLEQSVGGVKSTYNEKLGRWETDNANLGYGYNVGQYNDLDWYREAYGMTDEQIEAYRNDSARYHNFVDQRIVRNWIDESSGYTGVYAQFVNGPYGQLMSGTDRVPRDVYVDVQGDGFGEDSYTPVRDAQGNIVAQSPALKNNNTMSDYTKQFAAYVKDGVIQPGILRGGVPTAGHAVPASGSSPGGSALLEQWKQAAGEQTVTEHDYAVDQAVQQLLAAQKQAQSLFDSQRDQITRDERNALDNAALYAETRGDRGGIGQTQYNQIQAQAAANRQTVASAQAKLASDTNQQIIQLRAQGEFEKANDLLEISQTYLLKLLELEQWAAEYQLSTQKFQASVDQWQQEYLLKVLKLVG